MAKKIHVFYFTQGQLEEFLFSHFNRRIEERIDYYRTKCCCRAARHWIELEEWFIQWWIRGNICLGIDIGGWCCTSTDCEDASHDDRDRKGN